MRKQAFWIGLATLLLAGCATSKMNTASGGNEVTIRAPLATVKGELARAMIARGYIIQRSDDLVIEAERDAGTTAAVLFGTTANPYAQVRIRANLLADGETVRVILRGWMVDGNRSESPLAPSTKTQTWLEQVKQACEGK